MYIFFVIHSEKDVKNSLNSLSSQNYQNYSTMTRKISRYSLLFKVQIPGAGEVGAPYLFGCILDPRIRSIRIRSSVEPVRFLDRAIDSFLNVSAI